MGRTKLEQGETEQERIEREKAQFLTHYQLVGVKTAAANAVGHTLEWVNDHEKNDPGFAGDVHRAAGAFFAKHKHKMRYDYLFANMFPELKPPTQAVEATITNGLKDPAALDQLLAARGFVRPAGRSDQDQE